MGHRRPRRRLTFLAHRPQSIPRRPPSPCPVPRWTRYHGLSSATAVHCHPGAEIRDLRSLACSRGSPESLSGGRGAALALAWGDVIGAGFALPRDAGLETGAPLLRHAVRARRCRPEGGVVLPTRHLGWAAVSQARKKQWQRTLFAARVFGGMCERGDSPLSPTNRNSPPRAEGAQGSFDSGAKRRAVRGWGPTGPNLRDLDLLGEVPPSPDRSGLGVAQRRRRRFRAPARCRSEDRRSNCRSLSTFSGESTRPRALRVVAYC